MAIFDTARSVSRAPECCLFKDKNIDNFLVHLNIQIPGC